MTPYVIASTPRSGGNLLCETLSATGLAGSPAEFFEPTSRLAVHAAEVGFASAAAAMRDLPAYAAALGRRYATENGALGIKLHWDQVEWLRRCGTSIEALLGPCRYVYLTRGDVTRQAISLVRAKQTGSWTSLDAPRRRPEFDPVQIRDMIHWLTLQNRGWESFFASRRDAPLRLAYETVVPDRTAAAVVVLGFLGIACDREAVERRLAATPNRLARQADAVSDEWLRRWVAYLGSLPVGGAPAGAPAQRRVMGWLRRLRGRGGRAS